MIGRAGGHQTGLDVPRRLVGDGIAARRSLDHQGWSAFHSETSDQIGQGGLLSA